MVDAPGLSPGARKGVGVQLPRLVRPRFRVFVNRIEAVYNGMRGAQMARLRGVVDEGVSLRAEVTIGLRVGKPRPGSIVQEKGALLDREQAISTFLTLRAKQVGHFNAAATVTRCEGRWMGEREPVIECEIEHIPVPGREVRPDTFRRHMLDLAEQAAEKYGQELVIVRMDGHTFRVNARGEKLQPARPGGRIVR